MPICIAGMHRSGTSMIARMLHLCGLYLGEEEDLHEAQPDNPEGFWEHKRFQDINDKILRLFGGAWDTPPTFPDAWENDARLNETFEEAKRLVQEFAAHEQWGWKDPRSSLLLPFWKKVIPDLKVLVTLRNPVDVAASLTKRGYASQTFGFGLWNAYEAALEAESDPERSCWTHYSSYFADARQEIGRVASFCGLAVTPAQLEAAAATVAGGLRHSESTVLDLLESDAPVETVKLYLAESLRCGPVYFGLMKDQAKRLAGVEREKAMRIKDERIDDLEAKLRRRQAEIEELHNKTLRTASQIVALERHAGHLSMQVHALSAEAAKVPQLSSQLAAAQSEIVNIQHSGLYVVAQRMGRNRIIRGLYRAARKWKHEGFLSLFRAGFRRLRPKPQPAALQPNVPASPTTATGDVYIEDVREALNLDPTPISRFELDALLEKHLAGRPFALAISHDSFQAFTGGIQTLINDEMTTLNKDGAAQIHLAPVERIGKLSPDPERLEVIVSVDGNALAIAQANDAAESLAPLSRCLSVQIHHLMNWNLQIVDRILAAVEKAEKFFWLHDYYSVCESYNLLRNDRAFCNAPPLDSNSCSICKYGPSRAGHTGAFKDLFTRWNMKFLVPSQRGADVWLKAFPEFKDRLSVRPIYRLEPTAEHNTRSDPAQRKIRVAFPGISYEFKGWSHWRKLVDVLQANPDYELLHLGQKVDEAYYTTYPERYRNIRSNPSNPHALPDALEEEQVDIVFYCPIWPETFSLIAYEANSAGCFTLSTEESGNVAAYIKQAKSGKVFPSVDSLISYLLEPSSVRHDLNQYRGETPFLSTLRYNEEIVGNLYLDHKAP